MWTVLASAPAKRPPMVRRQAKILNLDFSRIKLLSDKPEGVASPLSHGIGNLKAALIIPISGDKRAARYPA